MHRLGPICWIAVSLILEPKSADAKILRTPEQLVADLNTILENELPQFVNELVADLSRIESLEK